MNGLSSGKPTQDGKYLVFVKDMKSPEWVKPQILQWHQNRWYFPNRDGKFWEKVYLWLGPLPSGKLDDIALIPMEYDL